MVNSDDEDIEFPRSCPPTLDGGEKFVFVNATNNPQKDRSHHRHLVHSHVSRYIWQQNRGSNRVQGQGAPDTLETERPQRHDAQHKDPKQETLRVRHQEETLENSRSQILNVLDEGLFDPFHSYPSVFYNAHQANAALKYAVTTMWPLLLPRDIREDPTADWIPSALAHSVLFSACIYGSAVHLHSRGLDISCIDFRKILGSEQETISALNSLLQDPAQAVQDEVILTVLTLTFNRNEAKNSVISDPDPQRPLQDLQWLRLYSSLPVNHTHVNGLAMLLELKGGLDKIHLPGLAALLSYSSILLASKEPTKPALPFYPLSRDDTIDMGHVTDPGADSALSSSFAKYPQELREIIHKMSRYNDVLDSYLSGRIQLPNMAAIADRRNWIQHKLLSLPLLVEVGQDHEFFTLREEYEIIRIALLLYSYLVIFPIPFALCPFGRLTTKLKEALIEGECSGTLANFNAELMMWAVSLGSVPNSAQRTWFVGRLQDLIAQAGVSQPMSRKVVLKSVMWHSNILDPLIGEIWNCMQRSAE